MRDPLNSSLIERPLYFSTTSPVTRFDTPENILLLLSVLRMKFDVIYLLMSRFADPLIPPEINLLENSRRM